MGKEDRNYTGQVIVRLQGDGVGRWKGELLDEREKTTKNLVIRKIT